MATRKFIFLLVLLFAVQLMAAQSGINTPWTWKHGDYLINQPGIFTYNPNHPFLMPGGRSKPASWTSTNGDLWLFGGDGYDINGSHGYLSDLWKYSGNQWYFVKGDFTKDAAPTYGTQSVAATSNNPGARNGSASWKDANGNLWLFGGLAPSPTNWQYLNDLWKFDPTINAWTWMHGLNISNQDGIYGTQGISAPGNMPGARSNCMTWIDNSGNFWLFGGNGPNQADFNDLWKYNPNTNEWTWMKGDQIIFQAGVYGTQGVSDAANKPGSRHGGAFWKDAGDRFWLFGGSGFAESLFWGGGTLNDLWMFDPASNEWTWKNGNKTLNEATDFGIQGIAGNSNKPGARTGSFNWIDATGNLWLFGGWGYGTNTNIFGKFNDLWKYNPITNQWTWMKGGQSPEQAGDYNVGGVPGFINKPGSRMNGLSWTTNNGAFWMFGGFGSAISTTPGYLNDLWSISAIDLAILPVKLTGFTATLEGNNVFLTWQTIDEKDFNYFILQRSFDGSRFENIATIYKDVQQANAAKFYKYQDVITSNMEKEKIFYRLRMVDNDGSFTLSKVLLVSEKQGDVRVSLYPNPVKREMTLVIDETQNNSVQIQVLNTMGEVVKKSRFSLVKGRNTFRYDVSGLPAGTYILSMKSSSRTMDIKFVKE